MTYLAGVSIPEHSLKVSLRPAFYFTWEMQKIQDFVDFAQVVKRANIDGELTQNAGKV